MPRGGGAVRGALVGRDPPTCGTSLPGPGSASASPACGASSNGGGSRSKDRACGRAGSSRRPGPARGLVEGRLDLDPHTLVFVDETGAGTTMARLDGRAPRGERLRAAIPHGHWTTTTFVGALRLDGMIGADGARRPDDGRVVPRLYRTGVRPHAAPRRRRDPRQAGGPQRQRHPSGGGSGRRHAPVAPALLADFDPIENASPSPRRSCAQPPPAPSITSGEPSATASMRSRPQIAPTASPPPPAVTLTDRHML